MWTTQVNDKKTGEILKMSYSFTKRKTIVGPVVTQDSHVTTSIVLNMTIVSHAK